MTERRQIVLDRHFHAHPAEVWEMWTTRGGIESWWGPDGFDVQVHHLDLTAGGRMSYSMKAVGVEQVEYMQEAKMPLVTTHEVVFIEVEPLRRLSYSTSADFIPGVAPYDVGTTVELTPTASGTHMILTLDAMHDDHWTQLAVAGWESELGRLTQALATRKDRA